MYPHKSRAGTGAALAAGALTLVVAASGTALAGQTKPQGGHTQSTALPSWYASPLNTAQVNAEVAVPKALAYYTGPTKLTKDAFTAGSGALAVDASQALGHALASGESLQLTNAFVLDGASPSAAIRAQLAQLAWSNVTSVTCEGYTDYGPHSFNRDQLLGRARAAAICALLHAQNPAIATKLVTYGSTRPVQVGGPVNTHHAQNRRVVIDVTGVSAPPTVATSAPVTTTPVVTTPVVTTPVVTTPVTTTPVVTPPVYTPPVITPPVITAPLAPTISATPGDTTATLTFAAPSSEATITGYEYSLDGGTTWQPLTTSGSGPLSATITGLTNGTAYSVEVRADSSAGDGAASNSVSVTPSAPSTVADAPVLTTGTSSWNNTTNDYWVPLSWTDSSDGGSPITGWRYSTDGTTWTTVTTSVTESSGTYSTSVDSGIDCSTDPTLNYTIEAINANGDSPASNASAATFGC